MTVILAQATSGSGGEAAEEPRVGRYDGYRIDDRDDRDGWDGRNAPDDSPWCLLVRRLSLRRLRVGITFGDESEVGGTRVRGRRLMLIRIHCSCSQVGFAWTTQPLCVETSRYNDQCTSSAGQLWQPRDASTLRSSLIASARLRDFTKRQTIIELSGSKFTTIV